MVKNGFHRMSVVGLVASASFRISVRIGSILISYADFKDIVPTVLYEFVTSNGFRIWERQNVVTEQLCPNTIPTFRRHSHRNTPILEPILFLVKSILNN